jgi:hypothetical protein
VVVGSMRYTRLTVSANRAAHYDIITLISMRSSLWVYAKSILMMRDDYPQNLLHNQAVRTNGVTGLALGTELVSSLGHESKAESWTCAVEGKSDATAHQNKDRGWEELHPLGGDTVGVCGLILGWSTGTATVRPRDHEAQPGLLPARCVALGSACLWHARRKRCEQKKCWPSALRAGRLSSPGTQERACSPYFNPQCEYRTNEPVVLVDWRAVVTEFLQAGQECASPPGTESS